MKDTTRELLNLMIACMVYLCVFDSLTLAETPYGIIWSRQIGTQHNETGKSIAVDSLGNVYLYGETYGDFFGTTNSNSYADLFLKEFDYHGNSIWESQFEITSSTNPNTSNDIAVSIGIDASNNFYIAGNVRPDYQYFVRKYSAEPQNDDLHPLCWSFKQNIISADVLCMSVDDSGNSYVCGACFAWPGNSGYAGVASHAFLTRFTSEGERDLSNEYVTHVMRGRTYTINGLTYYDCLSTDASAYSIVTSGICSWGVRQGDMHLNPNGDVRPIHTDSSVRIGNDDFALIIGTEISSLPETIPETYITSIKAGNSGFYVCGNTTGDLFQPITHPIEYFLAKYVDGIQTPIWFKQWNTSDDNNTYYLESIAIDCENNIYVCERIIGQHSGISLKKYDTWGNFKWAKKIESNFLNSNYYMIVDNNRFVYICGTTDGPSCGQYMGGTDAFVIKLGSPGDINMDGHKDISDLALFTPFMGTTSGATWETGDFDGDGMADITDLNKIQSSSYETTPSSGISPHVSVTIDPGMDVGSGFMSYTVHLVADSDANKVVSFEGSFSGQMRQVWAGSRTTPIPSFFDGNTLPVAKAATDSHFMTNNLITAPIPKEDNNKSIASTGEGIGTYLRGTFGLPPTIQAVDFTLAQIVIPIGQTVTLSGTVANANGEKFPVNSTFPTLP
jgi:hypothetical protein